MNLNEVDWEFLEKKGSSDSCVCLYKDDDRFIFDSEDIISKYYGTSFIRLVPDASDEVHILFAAYEKYKHLINLRGS